LVESVLVVSKGGYDRGWGVYRGLECYNNTCLFYKDKGQGQVRRIGNLAPGNVDIQTLGCWSRRNGDWVLRLIQYFPSN
jgi:hypothetical protein